MLNRVWGVFTEEFRRARQPDELLESVPDIEALRRSLGEGRDQVARARCSVQSCVVDLPLYWSLRCRQDAFRGFCQTLVLIGGIVIGAHATAWALDQRHPLSEDEVNGWRYALSAIAQSVAATTGLAFTALIIATQVLSERYATAATRFVLRDWRGHVAVSLGAWTVLSALGVLTLVKEGDQAAFGLPAPGYAVLMVCIASATISIVGVLLFVFVVLHLFSAERLLGAIEDDLVEIARHAVPRIASRSRRNAHIEILCSELAIDREAHRILFARGIAVDVGDRHVSDVNAQAFRSLINSVRGAVSPATTVSCAVTLDAGPGEVAVLCAHGLPAGFAASVRPLARQCVRTQRIPYDLWRDEAIGLQPVAAIVEVAMERRDLHLADLALGAFRRITSEACSLACAQLDVRASEFYLFSDASRQVQQVSQAFVDIFGGSIELTRRQGELNDAIQGIMMQLAQWSFDSEDLAGWAETTGAMSRHAVRLRQVGYARAADDWAETTRALIAITFWSSP